MAVLKNFSVSGVALSGAPTNEYDQLSARLHQSGQVVGVIGYAGTADGAAFNGTCQSMEGSTDTLGNFSVTLHYLGQEEKAGGSIPARAQFDLKGGPDGLVMEQDVVVKDLVGGTLESAAGLITAFQIKVQAYNAQDVPIPLIDVV